VNQTDNSSTTVQGRVVNRNQGCPVTERCQIGIKGVGFIVIEEYLDYFFSTSQEAAFTDSGSHHI
jgi:hypothetical protein